MQPPFIDPTIANGGGVIGGGAGRGDAAALPELVRDVQAPADREHDARRLLHREPRKPPEPPRAARGARLQHERSQRPGAWAPPSCNAHIDSDLAAQAPGSRLPTRASTATWRRRCGSIRSTRTSTGAVFPWAGASTTPSRSCSSSTLAHGLQYRVGYTYSKLKNNGAESGQGNEGINGGVQDPVNWTTADYGLSQDDTPHVLLVGFTWDIAQGSSESWTGAKKALLGGWNLSGILRYESGRPLRITMDNDMGGLLFNTQKRPNRTGADGVAASGDFDPDTDNYFNRDAWQDPGPLTFGNAPQGRRDGARIQGLQRRHDHLQDLRAERPT